MEIPTLEGLEQTPETEVPSAARLQAEASAPVTVAVLKQALMSHVNHCRAIRTIRRWTMGLAVMTGAVLAIQVLLAWLGPALIDSTVTKVLHRERASMLASHPATPQHQ